MNIKPIKTEQDYDIALERLEVVFDADPNTKEGDEAEILSLLIENYEKQHYPIEAPEAIESIKRGLKDFEEGRTHSQDTARTVYKKYL